MQSQYQIIKSSFFFLALMLMPVCAWAESKTERGLCAPQEKVFFACQAKSGKWINICGDQSGTVQYRFGHLDKIELAYPPVPDNQKLLYAHYFRYQVDRTEISFQNDGVSYIVFDGYEEDIRDSGVGIEVDGNMTIISCEKPATGSWAGIETLIACDKENALNLGGCPTP